MRAQFYPPTSVYELMHSFSPSDLSDSPCVNPLSRKIILEKRQLFRYVKGHARIEKLFSSPQ